MTQAGEIVKEAYRENNLIEIGREPTDAEVAEALPRLNNILRSLFGRTLGVYLTDWPVPPTTTSPVNARYPLQPASMKLSSSTWPYPPSNVRVIAMQTAATTIYLQQSPQDGARFDLVPGGADFVTAPLTINANGRMIAGATTLVQDTALTARRQFMYRADLSQWTEIVALTSTTDMPLPEEFDDYFICALNIRLSPRFSASADPLTGAILAVQEKDIKSRYWQDVDAPVANTHELRTHQSYPQGEFTGEDF